MIPGDNISALFPDDDLPVTKHATSVAYEDLGVLILGPSGSGKSTMGLSLMAFGATLISDDLTHIEKTNGEVVLAHPLDPAQKWGQIEARGLGLLDALLAGPVRLRLVIDLSATETARLPPDLHCELGQQNFPLFHKIDTPAFPAAIVQYLKVMKSREPEN